MGLRATDDAEILAYAHRERRVVYTSDTDYLALAQLGVPHAGIIYHHQRRYGIGEAIRRVVLASEIYTQEEMRNRVEYL